MTGFKILMIFTFFAAFITMLLGVMNLGIRTENAETSNKRSDTLMFARILFSAALFIEILIYFAFIR